MIIEHPILGKRDSSEFTYLGDASLIKRPKLNTQNQNQVKDNILQFHEYLYIRDNIADFHEELWYHEYGDRSWLIVTRNTSTHEIVKVIMANELAKKQNK